jgi:hypothetical protein
MGSRITGRAPPHLSMISIRIEQNKSSHLVCISRGQLRQNLATEKQNKYNRSDTIKYSEMWK